MPDEIDETLAPALAIAPPDGRGSGRTTRQMQDAPIGALFIWGPQQGLSYPRALARNLGREDLRIESPSIFYDGAVRLRGLTLPTIILDHDAARFFTPEQWHGFQIAASRIRPGCARFMYRAGERCHFDPSLRYVDRLEPTPLGFLSPTCTLQDGLTVPADKAEAVAAALNQVLGQTPVPASMLRHKPKEAA